MRIKWKGDTWQIKYYATGYARWTLENGNTSVSWLVNRETGENDFENEKEFIKFLREKENQERRLLNNILDNIIQNVTMKHHE